jgi:hypothetical protein
VTEYEFFALFRKMARRKVSQKRRFQPAQSAKKNFQLGLSAKQYLSLGYRLKYTVVRSNTYLFFHTEEVMEKQCIPKIRRCFETASVYFNSIRLQLEFSHHFYAILHVIKEQSTAKTKESLVG